MSDQVRDLLARLADEAGPPPQDPTMWHRARRARSRERLLVASLAVAAVLAIVIGGIGGLSALRATKPETAQRPDRTQAAQVPTLYSDPVGVGGLPASPTLAVGPAALVVANDTSVFVVSAADGVMRRVVLPGFDAPLYHRGGADVAGLALTPDGKRLAYGWHGPDAKPLDSGVRVVDLVSGEVTTLPRPSLYEERTEPRLLTWGFSWSADGRYLFTRVKITRPDDPNPWVGNPYWDCGYDTTTGTRTFESERGAGKDLPQGSDLSSPVRVASTGHYLRAVDDQMLLWRTNSTGSEGRPIPLPAGAKASSWPTGRFDRAGARLVLEPANVGRSLLLVFPEAVYDSTATSERAVELPLPTSLWPHGARVDLLGQTGVREALAMVHRPAARGGGWHPDADLVKLEVSAAQKDAGGVVLGHIPVRDARSDFSFATDVATVTNLTDPTPEPTHETARGGRDDALAAADGGAAWSAVGPRLGLAIAGAVALGLVLWTRRRAGRG